MDRAACCLLLALVATAPAQALSVLRADRVRSGAIDARDVAIRLAAGSVDLRAARATVAGVALEPRALRWRCTPGSPGEGSSCAGPLEATLEGKATRAELALARDAQGIALSLTRDRSRIALAVPSDGPAKLELARVPLAWLSPFAGDALPAAATGRVGGALVIAAFDPFAASGELALDGIGFDNADGTLAAADLGARVKLAIAGAGASRTYALDATVDAGAWLVAPLYVEIGDRPIGVAFELAPREGGYEVRSWRWQDPGALTANGSASLDASGVPERVTVAAFEARLERAYPRYGAPVLAGTAFGKLETAGALRGDLAWARAAPLAGTITLDEVTMHDADGRFALDGVDGRVPLGADAARDETLRWRSAALHRIPVSGGSLVLRAQHDRHALAAPLELALLDGRLRITRFALVRDGGARRIEAALALDAISVDALTRALGWPAFGGSLSGTIPALRSEGDVITFEGGLSFDVFGGRIEASALTLERAFGVAPSLAAELAIEDLDLEALTSAFSFGTITGRLDGRIAGLRLLDWSPVAFDLSLATDPGYEGRKRISQRAVGSLSAVGGAGAAGGIQRGVMGIFDTFPYAAIGLTCRLRDNVCEMGGLDSENGGYTIVRGAGLPRLTVVGHQRRVDWPVLVARLKAATEGDGPVVE